MGAAPGACAMHDVANRPKIKNSCTARESITEAVLVMEKRKGWCREVSA